MLTDLEEWLLHPKKTFLESHDIVQVVHPLAVEKCILDYISKRMEIRDSNIHLDTDVYSSIILNSQKVETTQVLINR